MSGIVAAVKDAFIGVPHTPMPITRNKKILICLTSAAPQMPDHRTGFFFGELLHPYEVFTKNGFDVDIVSETGSAQADEASLGAMAGPGDKKKWDDKEFPLHAKLAQMRPATQVNPSDYAAIYFAGGHGACADFPTATNLKSLAARIYEAGGVVGADCHGPAIFDQLLLSNGQPLLAGKTATGFSVKGEEAMPKVMEWMREHKMLTMQETVEKNGGTWREHKTNPMGEYVEVSDRVVTGMNPASAAPVAQHIVDLLPTEKVRVGHTTSTATAAGVKDNRTTSSMEAEEREKGAQYKGETAAAI